MEEDQIISDEAVSWVKANKNELIDKFILPFPKLEKPISIFMAGSPGAGKTEFSKHLICSILNASEYISRIDPDEIRVNLPQYVPGKAEIFQSAVAIAVEKLHDFAISNSRSFLLDGTLADINKARSNIKRSVNKKRPVLIQYIHQPPLVAWNFTKAREKVEGRNIPKEAFIQQFFAARNNIDILKKEFGDSIRIDLIERDISRNIYKPTFNITSIDKYIKERYTKESLSDSLN